ncbi:MAG: WXG100 family type VII secretion target [Oscillospiraceae bacterium]|nr:WXG100 family type VII secretion target [Oscillospiraceae bacterium]
MTSITLSTQEVLGYASQIETDNGTLRDLLNESKSHLDSLATYWTGGASSATLDSYNTFANKYFQSYYEILDQYVKFLRANVAENYEETERVDTQLADAFK